MISRRGLLGAGIGVAATGGVGAAAWSAAPGGAKYRLKERFGLNPDPYVPHVPEGQVRIDTVTSATMGELPLFVAVPEGHGDGAGLPVLVVLHGSSATVADFRGFGFARFATAAALAGFPMAVVGTEDGPVGWTPSGYGDDPQAMLRDEMPGWLADRGLDSSRLGLWGWSRGGLGALEFAVANPGWARALALFSPAVHAGTPLIGRARDLGEVPVGLWCGAQDAFNDGAKDLARTLTEAGTPLHASVLTDGGHTRQYWNDQTLPMMRWLGPHLA